MPNGQNVLVQTLPLRSAADGSERAARDQFERAISLATLQSAAAGDPILAHRALGGADDRTLVWLLPMSELARPKIRTREELLGLGIGVLTQIAERHQRGQTAPLLSEHAITAHGRIAGAQVFAAGPWLGEEVAPIRVAPEEQQLGWAVASGDLWRLGQMLSELARQFALPREVSRLLHPDPRQRPSAAEAIDQFDAAFGRRTPIPATPIEELLFEPVHQDTASEEPELDFAEPLLPPRRSWFAPVALAGLSAGALLCLLPS